MISGSMLAAVLIAVPGSRWAQGRAQDALTVFKAGDTARASAVNANFQLLLERMEALAAANERLTGKVDSLQKAKPSAPNGDSLQANIAGIWTQIQILDSRMDSLTTRPGEKVHADSVIGLAASLAGKADLSHVHPVSQVTGLQDSLKARVTAKGGPLKVCSGRTAAGAGWVNYSPFSVYIDVDTETCGFASIPQYFTSLGGATMHYTTTGVTSIYSPTATKFRVYVAHTPWAATPGIPPAGDWGLFVNWVAIGP